MNPKTTLLLAPPPPCLAMRNSIFHFRVSVLTLIGFCPKQGLNQCKSGYETGAIPLSYAGTGQRELLVLIHACINRQNENPSPLKVLISRQVTTKPFPANQNF